MGGILRHANIARYASVWNVGGIRESSEAPEHACSSPISSQCLPQQRVWPGQVCEACARYGYSCSEPLSARHSRAAGKGKGQNLIAEPHASPEEIQILSYTALYSASAAGSNNTPTKNNRTAGVLPGTKLGTPQSDQESTSHSPTRPTRSTSLILLEPSNHRVRVQTFQLLNERLAMLWGSKSTYQFVCSSRFSNTVSDVFSYSVRQLAETDNMVNAALLAFCAADSTINTTTDLAQEFRVESWRQSTSAIADLRKTLAGWPEFENRDFMAPMATIFLLAAYGICADDLEILPTMTALLTTCRTRSAIFPLALQFNNLPNNGWRMRIYLADDPSDSGLICGHDTNLFDFARDIFTTAVLSPGNQESSRIEEL